MPAILTKALAAVGSCPAHPQLSIAFTVKDISAIREEMLRRGYPEEFVRFICAEMNTDFTADKIISYIAGEKHRLEDVADEMVAIRELRDRLVDKHISEHAQSSINIVPANEKTLRGDIELLQDLGLDIVKVVSRPNRYFWGGPPVPDAGVEACPPRGR